MNKLFGIFAGAAFIFGLTMNPTVFAADTDPSTSRDTVGKEDVKHVLSPDKGISEKGGIEKDHSLVVENEKEEHDALHEDQESSVGESHESHMAETHDSGSNIDRHLGSK